MRTLSDDFKNKLKAGEIPEIVIKINSVDYSEYLVNPERLRIDRKITKNFTNAPIDITFELYDPDGSIEAVINDDTYDLEVSLKFGSEEVKIFEGIVDPTRFQRKGEILEVRGADRLKNYEFTKLVDADHIDDWDKWLGIRSIPKWLLQIFADSNASDIVNCKREFSGSTRAAVSHIDSIDYASESDADLEFDEGLGNAVFWDEGLGQVGGAVVVGRHIVYFRLNPSVDLVYSQITRVRKTDLSTYGSYFRVLGYKGGLVYLVGQNNDNFNSMSSSRETKFFTWDPSSGSISVWYTESTAYDAPSIFQVGFDYSREVFVYVKRNTAINKNWTLCEVSSSGITEVADGYQSGIEYKLGWGARSYDDTKFVYAVGAEGADTYYFVYDGSSWSSPSAISEFHLRRETTAFYASSHLNILGEKSNNWAYWAYETDTVTELTGKSYVLNYQDRYYHGQRAVVRRGDLNADLCLIFYENLRYNYVYEIVNDRGFEAYPFWESAFKTHMFPFYAITSGDLDVYAINVVELTYNDIDETTIVLTLYSDNKRIPHFIFHPEAIKELTVRDFIETAEIFGNIDIKITGDWAIKTFDRHETLTEIETLSQDDYEVNPPQKYVPRISRFKGKVYYMQWGDGWLHMGGGENALEMSVNTPLVDFILLKYTLQWYLDNYAEENALHTIKTRNLIYLEEFDIVKFYDPIYRYQTGRVIGTTFEYPLGYILKLRGQLTEVQTDPPPIPEPLPSAPDWENVSMDITRMGQGVVENIKLTLSFNDTGGLPIRRIHWYIVRNGYDPNGTGLVEDETIVTDVVNPAPGGHEVNVFIQASYYDDLDVTVWGEDWLGRTTSHESFSFPGLDEQVLPKTAIISAGSISDGAVLGTENTNPTFEDVDLDEIPDGWTVETSGDVTFNMLDTLDFGGKWTPEFYWPSGGTGTGEIYSNYIPIGATGYQVKRFVALYLYFVASGATLKLQIECWDKDKSSLIQTLDKYTTSADVSGQVSFEFDPNTETPPGTRYVRLKLYVTVTSATAEGRARLNYFRIIPKTYVDELEIDENLDMNGKRITNLADPVDDQDAATKYYVDTTGGGGTTVMPKYIYIKATGQSPGNLTLSGSDWATSKALIKFIRVETNSTDWDLTLYPNSSFDTSGTIAPYKVIEGANGNQDIHLDYPYHDEDDANNVYVKYTDNSGSNTATIWIIGFKLS